MRLLALALTGALLTGCVADEPEPTASPSRSPTDSSPTEPDPTPTPVSAPLTWEPTGHTVEETVTTGQGWTIVVDRERSLATLDGPHPTTVAGDKRFRVAQVLLDEGWAVVVLGDSLQQRPPRATLVDLTTGRRTTLDGRSDPPTVNGGTWALQGDVLVHATRGPDRAYCLARRDLGTGTAAIGWCAQPRHGFTNARVTPAGIGLMTFDDQRPSCRTLGIVADGELSPAPGVRECGGWELVPAPAGAVWSVVPDENALDESLVYAAGPDGAAVDLGPATSDTLTWCAGATYFVRDPQTPGDPARLLRWTEAAVLEVVYETPAGGPSFLEGPRCGGDRITVSVFAESGDQQVSAPVD